MPRDFNGTSQEITADSAAGFSEQNPYSIGFWINGPSASNALSDTIYSEGRSTTTSPFILIIRGNAAGKIAVTIRSNAGGSSQVNATNTAASSLTAIDGTWHHVLFTQNGASTCAYALYIDGAADANIHGTYTSAATTIDSLTMAEDRRGNVNQAGHWFTGKMAHVAVWHRQLSANEAKSLGSGALPSHFAPEHYWPLWGIDSPEPDLGTASHVSGTIVGSAPQGTGGPPVSGNLLNLNL